MNACGMALGREPAGFKVPKTFGSSSSGDNKVEGAGPLSVANQAAAFGRKVDRLRTLSGCRDTH
jgi:hypothetical protein